MACKLVMLLLMFNKLSVMSLPMVIGMLMLTVTAFQTEDRPTISQVVMSWVSFPR